MISNMLDLKMGNIFAQILNVEMGAKMPLKIKIIII